MPPISLASTSRGRWSAGLPYPRAEPRFTRDVSQAAGADDVVVDVLFASSGIEPEIVAAAEPVEIIPGLEVPVARTGHLIAVKILARDDETRPQDLADLRALLAVAHDDDIELARTSIGLITQRGFHRDRDLVDLLRQLLR